MISDPDLQKQGKRPIPNMHTWLECIVRCKDDRQHPLRCVRPGWIFIGSVLSAMQVIAFSSRVHHSRCNPQPCFRTVAEKGIWRTTCSQSITHRKDCKLHASRRMVLCRQGSHDDMSKSADGRERPPNQKEIQRESTFVFSILSLMILAAVCVYVAFPNS